MLLEGRGCDPLMSAPVRPEALPAAKPPSSDTRVEVVPRIADVAAADWDACANPDPAAVQSVPRARLPCRTGRGRHGRQTHGLDAAASGAQEPMRRRRRLRAGLSQIAQPGRVRVRPCLGRCLSRRPAATTIPSCRSPCRSRRCRAGACWCVRVPPRPSRRRRSLRRPLRWWSATGCRACTSRSSAKANGRGSASGLPAAHRPAVPLAQRGLRHLRRFPGLACLAQTQGGAQGARAGAQRRPDRRMGHRPRPHGGALGRVLRLLHGHRLAQVGAALSQPEVLLAAGRGHARALPAGDGQARQASRSPARST